MQLLELFAWTRSVWKVFEKAWYRVYSLDYEPKFKCEITMNILDFEPGDFPDICPAVIWASPDCTSFSFAAWNFHRDISGRPKTEKAILWEKLLKRTFDIIDHYLRINPNLIFYIENPRGYMSRHPILLEAKKNIWFVEHLITYCSYWHQFRKPTNIWTNNLTWIPRKRCAQKRIKTHQIEMFEDSACKHTYCSHNWSTWLSSVWRAGDSRRSVIPIDLVKDILSSSNSYYGKS